MEVIEKMNKPLLQLALDNRSLEDALSTMNNNLEDYVDIIEVGTWLILCEGLKAIKTFRDKYPNKLLVADHNSADSGFLKLVMQQGADLNTAIAVMPDDLLKECLDDAKEIGCNVQVCLYGDLWNLDDCKRIRELGAEYIVVTNYHDEWTKQDVENVRAICDMGFKVSIADGVTKDTLKLFKGIPIYAVVMGGAIRKADDPVAAAKDIQKELEEIWRD